MRIHTLIACGIAASLALALTPAQAIDLGKLDFRWTNGGRPHYQEDHTVVKVTITKEEEVKVYQPWYEEQMRIYDCDDEATGEHLNDLLQLVTEVTPNRLMVSDHEHFNRAVHITDRTHITFIECKRTRVHLRRLGKSATELIEPGDLAVIEGYLRTNGSLVATNIRIYDRANGWDDEQTSDYGSRLWGEVRDVDIRHGQMMVQSNLGRRIISVPDGAITLANGKKLGLDDVRNDDRVVVYFRSALSNPLVQAYRVAVLSNKDVFPEGNNPYWADTLDGGNIASASYLEGHIVGYTEGAMFNKIVLRTDAGRDVIFYAHKSRSAARHGERVMLGKLQYEDHLRIAYHDNGGNYLAVGIEIR